MRLEQLNCLVEISRHKSLNMASETLNMTQQELSSSMKTLEKELGVQVLHRSRKGCTLTAEGERLLAFAKEVLPSYQRLLNEYRGTTMEPPRRNPKGTLQIYINSVFYLALLSEPIKRFCESHPQLRVVILSHSSGNICAKLAEQHSEGVHRVGFINVPCERDGSPCKAFLPSSEALFKPLASGNHHACVSTSSPLASSASVSIRMLLGYPLVIGASDDASVTPLHYLLSHYGAPHVALSVASLPLWNQAIASNVGVGLLHDIFLEHDDYIRQYVSNMVLIPITEPLQAVTGYLTAGKPDSVVDALLQYLPHGQRATSASVSQGV